MKRFFLFGVMLGAGSLACAQSHLPGELDAADILNGTYPWPASPQVPVAYNDAGLARERLSSPPAPGIHPRVLLSPQDLPDLRHRLTQTATGRALQATLRARINAALHSPANWGGEFFAKLAAEDVPAAESMLREKKGPPPPIGHYQPFLYAFTLEAFDALISEDAARGARIGTALAAYSRLIEPLIDRALAQPLGDDVWRAKVAGPNTGSWTEDQGVRDLVGYHLLGYTYDFAFNFMTPAQRADVRRVIAKVTHGRLWLGARLPHHFRNWNWVAVGLGQPLLALAIEGEEGFDPRVYRLGVEIARDYLTYAISPTGMSTEAVGYTQFGFVWANPFFVAATRRGEDLLSHSHLRAMLDWYLHSLEPTGVEWTSHGDGGDSGPALWTLSMFHYFFPRDPKVAALWQANLQASGGKAFDGSFHLIEPLVWADDPRADVPSAPDKIGLSLALFDPIRSSLNTRSAWTSDAATLQFECRTDSVAASHEHADRGNFTFFALGRPWAKESFRSIETRHHNSVLVDGLGQGFWPGPGRWLGYVDRGWALLAACDAKDAYDWMWPKSILLDDPATSARLQHPRWASYLGEAKKFQAEHVGVRREPETRPSVVAHFEGFEAHDPRMWDEDGRPTRFQHNPVQRAFRSVAFVRGPRPYLVVVDDIQKDDRERLYEWLLITGSNTDVAGMKDSDIVLCDATVARDEAGTPKPKKGDRQLLVRILSMNEPALARDYASRPSARLETFEKKDTTASNGRSFGAEKRLVIGSRSVAPDFRILLYPFRAGEPLPTTTWTPDHTKLTLQVAATRDEFAFARGPDGRTRVSVSRPDQTNVELP